MGEEVKITEYETSGEDNNGEEDRILDWEMGLPSSDDLISLSHPLITPELASAFSISPEPYRTLLDVNRASQSTLSNLRDGGGQLNALSSNNFKSFNADRSRDPTVVAAEENNQPDRDGSGSDSRKLRRIDSEEADSAFRTEISADDPSARTLKRPRLVWTPQLHKRFVDVVAHLGIKNAVPKTIMQLMNVEGLTRENVASHLQKYRLYLKRMQGLSSEGPSSSDQLFASTPVPQSLHENGGGGGGSGGSGASHGNGHLGVSIPVPCHPAAGAVMPMPMYGHMGMPMGINHHHHGFDGNLPYNMLQQRDWSGNNYGSVVSFPHHPQRLAPNDNM